MVTSASSIEAQVDKLVLWLQPTRQAEKRRKEIFLFVKRVISSHLTFGHAIILTGSTPLRTYLPDSDLDVTVLFPPGGR